MIRFPRFRSGAEDFAVEPMTADHAAAAAEIHSEGFASPWTDGDIGQFLAKPGVSGFVARLANNPASKPEAFVLIRNASNESEILTIAVAKSWRRRGLGRVLMDSVIRFLHGERIASLFLEVSEANLAAIGLYKRLGFKHVAARPDYYVSAGGERENAMVMRLDLS